MSLYNPKIGHLVTLKSGGPLMTIKAIGYSKAGSLELTCAWFTKDDQLIEAMFRGETLIGEDKTK